MTNKNKDHENARHAPAETRADLEANEKYSYRVREEKHSFNIMPFVFIIVAVCILFFYFGGDKGI